MKESLQKEITELSNQRDELNQKISQKRLELNELFNSRRNQKNTNKPLIN